MYRTEFWTLWERTRVGCFKRTASKHVYYLGWNRSPAQAGCMRQVLGPGALGRPRAIGWRGRWEGASGWGIHVNPWLIHVNVWQKPLQYCKVISLQLIKINEKKKVRLAKKNVASRHLPCLTLSWPCWLLNMILTFSITRSSGSRNPSYSPWPEEWGRELSKGCLACMCAQSLIHVWLCNPMDYRPLPMGFSRQEY